MRVAFDLYGNQDDGINRSKKDEKNEGSGQKFNPKMSNYLLSSANETKKGASNPKQDSRFNSILSQNNSQIT